MGRTNKAFKGGFKHRNVEHKEIKHYVTTDDSDRNLLPTLILLVAKMDNSTNHRCHGVTATDGNYALVSGDLYTNAYNIEAMEVS